MTKAARVSDYLAHISKAIERISRYTADLTDSEFLADEMVQDAELVWRTVKGDLPRLHARIKQAQLQA